MSFAGLFIKNKKAKDPKTLLIKITDPNGVHKWEVHCPISYEEFVRTHWEYDKIEAVIPDQGAQYAIDIDVQENGVTFSFIRFAVVSPHVSCTFTNFVWDGETVKFLSHGGEVL